MNIENMRALYIVVNAGFSEEVIGIARAEGAGGATILNARGEGKKSQTIMGITVDVEKEIVLCIVNKKIADSIMKVIKNTIGVNTPAHGICFYMPIGKATETVTNLNGIIE